MRGRNVLVEVLPKRERLEASGMKVMAREGMSLKERNRRTLLLPLGYIHVREKKRE
jgi:hypothetical protein